MRRADRPSWPMVLLFMAGYVAAASFAFSFAYVNPIVSPIWPPSGLAIAFLLVVGVRAWPAAFLAAFAVNAAVGQVGVPTALGIATGNTLEAMLAVYLARRWIGPGSVLDHPTDVLRYVLFVALLAPMASATVGVSSLFAGGLIPSADVVWLWLLWWQGDAGGAIVVAPAILAIAEAPRHRLSSRRLLEAALLAAGVTLTALLAFAIPPFRNLSLEYLPLPMLVLATFRFGRLGAALGTLVVLTAAVGEAAFDSTALTAWRASQELLQLQAYTEVVGITLLLLAAVVTEREESRQRLHESLSRLRAQMEASLDGILTIDENRRVIGYNGRFAEIWGVPAPLLIEGDDRSLLAYVRPQIVDWPAFISRVEHLYAHPMEESRDEVRLVDGRILDRWSAPARMPGGCQHGRIWYFRDATERIRQAETLRRQNARLQEVDRLKSNLVSAVSHELRTPLTSIVGYAEFLEDEVSGPLTPGQADQVHMIQAGARTLQRLVDDLLDFARLESGHFRLLRADADLGVGLQEVVDAARPAAAAARVSLTLSLPSTPVTLSVDPQRIGQVVANLVNNALKFTPPGGRVAVSLRATRDDATVEVADTGPGISAEHLPHLFQRFYQVDTGLTRARGGAGLGLAISRAIVEAHGGRIGVLSEPGQGSRFFFTLPRGPGATPSADAAPGTQEVS